MPASIFPAASERQAEIPIWVKLEAFKPRPNLTGDSVVADDDSALTNSVAGPYWIQAPQQVILGDSHQYNQVNFKALQGTLSAADRRAFSDLIDAARVAGSDLPIIGDVGTNINYATQQTANPREEVVFAKPNFRSLSLSWELAIQDTGDSDSIQSIIDNVRKFSYPTVASAFLYEMPAQWLVTIGAINQSEGLDAKFFKFGKCVLENLSTNYTGAGVMSLTSEGGPAFINLDMTFKEVKLRNQGSAVFS